MKTFGETMAALIRDNEQLSDAMEYTMDGMGDKISELLEELNMVHAQNKRLMEMVQQLLDERDAVNGGA